jgi:hypothetical protein
MVIQAVVDDCLVTYSASPDMTSMRIIVKMDKNPFEENWINRKMENSSKNPIFSGVELVLLRPFSQSNLRPKNASYARPQYSQNLNSPLQWVIK